MNTNKTVKQFDIYWANLDGYKGGIKTRPVIIISNNIINESATSVLVATATTNTSRVYPTDLVLNIGGKRGKINFNTVFQVDKSKLDNKIQRLSPTDRLRAKSKLKKVFDLD